MIQPFVDKFIAGQEDIKKDLKLNPPDNYDDLVERVIKVINPDTTEYSMDELPDPERIHIIDDGNYQGTRLYIIGITGYQPSTYWSIYVSYGSCSGCDSFQAIQNYEDTVSDQQADDYYLMMLHMVQSMKEISDEI
jgi:hypothetical protein